MSGIAESNKKRIKEFIELDNEIAEINKNLKSLRLKRSAAADEIQTYMVDNNIAKVDVGDSKLRISVRKLPVKLNKHAVISTLRAHVHADKIEEVIENLFDIDTEEIKKLERSKT